MRGRSVRRGDLGAQGRRARRNGHANPFNTLTGRQLGCSLGAHLLRALQGKAGLMTSRMTPSPKRGSGSLASLCAIACLWGAVLALPAESPAQNIPLPPPEQAQQMLQQAVQLNPALADVIRARIQSSGLSPEQIRARLAAGGYPPDLLDPYLTGAAGPTQGAVGAQEVAAVPGPRRGPVPPPPPPRMRGATGPRRAAAQGVPPPA